MPSLPDRDWLRPTIESALLTIDNDTLTHATGAHVQVEGEFGSRKVRPSLLGGDCKLQMVKRFRGHTPQPNSPWMASRQGMPDANTNLNFLRGFLGEGALVAALKNYAEMTQDFEVLGCAPSLVFEHEDYQAHPDIMILRHGEIELIQIKTPSVWAFERMDKGSPTHALEKYRVQMVTEMYIGRRMEIDIRRSNLLLFTWEGHRPGTDQAGQIRTIVAVLEWEQAMVGYVENLAKEVRDLDAATGMGRWPRPANDESDYNKWPCSYCSYARTPQFTNQIVCTEVEKWEQPESTQERLEGHMRAALPPHK